MPNASRSALMPLEPPVKYSVETSGGAIPAAAIVDERFYGPCARCRLELRAKYDRAGRVIEVAEYEPKINVTPNAVAVKDD